MTLEHDDIREKLIATTLRLMEEGGLENVKARSVASAVGVSVGTVYNLFGTIDGLILAANMRVFGELNELGHRAMADLIAGSASGEGANSAGEQTLFRLLGLSRAYIDFVTHNRGRWSALLAFNRTRKAAADPAYVSMQEALIDIVGEVLEDTPLNARPAQRRLAAHALWSSVHGIVSINDFGPDDTRAVERTWAQVELLVSAFVRGIFVPE